MGLGHSEVRLPPRVYGAPSSELHQTSDNSSRRSGAETSSLRRDPTTGSQSSHPQGSGSRDSLLVDILSSSQEGRHVATDSQPQTSQQVHKAATLPHGIPAGDITRARDRMVGSIAGSSRRLFARANASFVAEMAGFLCKPSSVPVHLPAVRPIHGPPNIHQGSKGRGRIPPSKRTPDLRLPRRLAVGSPVPSTTVTHNRNHARVDPAPRPHREHQEVSADSSPADRVLGSKARLPARESLPDSRARKHSRVMRRVSSAEEEAPSEPMDEVLGSGGESGSYAPFLPHAYEGGPTTRSVGIQHQGSAVVHGDSQVNQCLPRPTMVDRPPELSSGMSVHIQSLVLHADYGRVQDGLGRALQGHSDVRTVDHQRGEESHQHTRAVGSSPSSPSHSSPSQGSQGDGGMRQYDSRQLPQPAGRHEEQDPLHADPTGSAVVSAPRHRDPGSPPSGGRQHSRGRPVKKSDRGVGSVEGPRIVRRVAPAPINMPADFSADGAPSGGSLRKQAQCAAADVLLLEQGPSSSPPGCDVDELGEHQRLRLPSDCSHSESLAQADADKIMQDDPGLPEVAETAVVSPAPVPAVGDPPDSPSQEGSSVDSGDQASRAINRGDRLNCLASFVESARAAGFSEQAAELSAKARRSSTRQTYDKRLRPYLKWCRTNKVDHLQASLKDIADYLVACFNAGSAVNSVRVHRTAIGAIHMGFPDGSTVSNNRHLNLLIRGMHNERPPDRSLVPDWDLSMALRLLAKAPYEPIAEASLEDLTKKTVFLVAVASGRRVGDIQALSVANEHLDINNIRARLLPRSGYLAKNQRPDFVPSPIVLPDLRAATDDDSDGPWCPVRALRWYKLRTNSLRGKEDHLFVITKKPYSGASKQTIARWLVDIIKASIREEDLALMGRHVNAHTIRAQAAAWASYKGASLAEVIDAMGWSSTTSFQSTYLRDVYARGGATAARILSAASRNPHAAAASSRTSSM